MSTTFAVVAEPTRRRILDLLRERARSVGELVEQLGLTQPGVSKHLRVLREAGLVGVRRDAQRRWYELRTEPLRELDDWLEPYRAFFAD
jgi:DNA-binding transcriptional ArsR family regulator